MTGRARSLVVLALLVGCFLAPAGAAFALWSTTATATLTSVQTAAAPAAPTNPANFACAGKNDPRTLSWTAGARATEYRVYRGTVLIVTTTTLSTPISESDLGTPMPNNNYTLTVKAWNVSGESSGVSATFTFKSNKDC